MPLSSPIEAWLQMAQNRNQNRRDMYSDIAGIGQGLGDTAGGIGGAIQAHKKKQLLAQIVQAMQTQGAPQQGPQMPPTGAGPQQPPMSGMGAPPQDNTAQMKGLLMQYDPQGMTSQLEGTMFPKPQVPMNPLQLSEIAKNQALANRLGQPAQPKPTNPLDDEIKRCRAAVLAAVLNRMKNTPAVKPPNPVPAAALDVRTQIANNAQAPWYKKLGMFGGLKPVVNTLKSGAQTSSSSANLQDMSDEELLRLASEDDSGQ